MQVQTINIALPKLLVKKIDEVAEKDFRNRSELIREALRVYLKELEEWDELFEYSGRKAKKLGIKSEEEVNKIVAKYRKSH